MIELRRRYSGGVQSPSFSRLPKEYREVEYIESTGVQRLHLPTFNTNSDFNIEMSVSITEYSEWTPLLVSPARLNIWIGCHQDNFVLRSYSGVNIIATKKPDTNKFFSVKISRVNDVLSLYVDGALINSATYTFNVTSDFFVYFADSPFNPTYSKFKSKELKYDNYHFIPCYRISDHKPGMYDIVNEVFYVNQGVGEFSYGQDVHYNIPPEYQQVEYLESTGGQYIDTGVMAAGNLEIRIDAQMTGGNHVSPALLSAWTYESDIARTIYINRDTKNIITYSYTSNEKTLTLDNFNSYIKNTYVCNSIGLFINDTFITSLHFDNNEWVNPLGNTYKLLYFPHSTRYLYGRLFYCSFSVGDTLVRNLIPCYRKADDVAGMYDLVSGEFYTNAGTGKFDVGLDVIG